MSKTARRSKLGLAFDAVVRSRENQARRYVNAHLLSMDDATLRSLGYDRRELMRQGSAQRGL